MDIKSIFKSVLTYDTDEDGFMLPRRFSESQKAKYDKLPHRAYAYANAGMLMDFYTDADEISFEYVVYNSWTTMFKDSTPTFDIFENDILTKSTELSYSDAGCVHNMRYTCEKSGEKKITVVFPANAVVAVRNIKIGNFRPTEEKKRKFLILGDSISSGLQNNTASNNYALSLRRFFDADFLNQSVGGDCFNADILEKTDFEPTDVIVALGTNEMVFTQKLEKSEKNIKSYFARLSELFGDKKIYAVTPIWTTMAKSDPESFKLLLGIAEKTAQTASEYGYTVIDGMKLVPHDKRYYSDALHPNDLGFAHYSLNIIKALLNP